MNHPPNIRCCEIESKKVMPVHKIVEPSVTWSNRSKISLTLHWFHVFEIHHRLWEFRSSLSNNWCYCFWNLPAVIVKTTVLSGLYFEKRNWCNKTVFWIGWLINLTSLISEPSQYRSTWVTYESGKPAWPISTLCADKYRGIFKCPYHPTGRPC